MKGAIANVTVDANAKAIQVITYPDPDIPGSGAQNLLSRLDQSGKLKWQLPQTAVPKEQDLAWDGSVAIVSTYENELFLLNSARKKLWSVEGNCKPAFVPFSKRVYCFHDDNVRSTKEGQGTSAAVSGANSVADVFDPAGKKTDVFTASSDLVANKISIDGKSVLLGFADGTFQFKMGESGTLQSKKVDGRIVDVAVSTGDHPKVAVLYWEGNGGSDGGLKDPLKKQNIKVFEGYSTNAGGSLTERIFPVPSDIRAVQLEISPAGEGVFYYGISPQGQSVGGVLLSNPKSAWQLTEHRPSDYLSSIVMTRGTVIQGLNSMSPQGRVPKVRGIDFKGQQLWELTLHGDPGAYLYSLDLSLDESALLVGLDDGHLSFVSLGKPPEKKR